jgi:hypothetical protein
MTRVQLWRPSCRAHRKGREPMKPLLTGFLVAAMACLGAADDLYAQPVTTSSSSVEWMAANSPLIVRGVIDEISVHDPNDGFHRYQTVSVRVLETVKGPRFERLQFVHSGDFGPVRIGKLRDDRQPLLLFLNDWARSPRFDRSSGRYAYARFPYLVEEVAVLTPKDVRFAHSGLPPLSNDLTVLSTPEQLIDAIRAYLRRPHERVPVQGVTIELPPDLRGGFYRVDFTYPADARIDHARPAVPEPVLDFATYKDRFAKKPPATRKPPYTRDRGGYIGVYALELMAADCDVIVRGVIEDCCFVADTDDPTGPSYGIKFRVLETLKGKASDQINFYMTDARDVETLQTNRQEIVVFLNLQSSSKREDALGHRTRAMLWDDSVIVLDRDRAEVLFADLTWHREPGEVLERLGEVTRRPLEQKDEGKPRLSRFLAGHRGPPVFAVYPPASLVAGSSIAGNVYSVIYLPVDTNLEADARRWAAADSKDLRWLAARAIVYFKSDENAKLLGKLLGDEGTWSLGEMRHLIRPLYNESPEYLVRWESWHVLDGWGYVAEKPNWGRAR